MPIIHHFVTDITRDELPVLGYDVIVVLGLVSLQLPGVREPYEKYRVLSRDMGFTN